MAWIQIHEELEGHPKVLRLAALAQIDADAALGKLVRLWFWARKYAEDGDLRRHGLGVISAYLGVDAATLTDGEKGSGWIDTAPYLRIHDWWIYSGRFLQVKYKHAPDKWQRIRDLYAGVGEFKEPFKEPLLQPLKNRLNKNTSTPSGRTGAKSAAPALPPPIPYELTDLELYRQDAKLCHRLPEVLPAWEKAYPGLNIGMEIRKAHAWEVSNPARRKRDRIKFLANWLNRAQDNVGKQYQGQEVRPDPYAHLRKT